jgi:hypothetical protein
MKPRKKIKPSINYPEYNPIEKEVLRKEEFPSPNNDNLLL